MLPTLAPLAACFASCVASALNQPKPETVSSLSMTQQLKMMLNHLAKRFGERATMGDRAKLFMMRAEAERLEKAVEAMREKKVEAQDTADDRGSEDESDEEVSGSSISLN